MVPEPEQFARGNFDALLAQVGWQVCGPEQVILNFYRGDVITEFPLLSHKAFDSDPFCLAKEGRKYGVGLAVVSQRPHELSETVLAQCGTFICLRITNPNDQSYVKNLVPEAERGLVDILAGLGRGECLGLGEAVPLPTRFRFNRPSPVPNSEDIDFYKKWKDGPDDIDVEAIVDRWRRQKR